MFLATENVKAMQNNPCPTSAVEKITGITPVNISVSGLTNNAMPYVVVATAIDNVIGFAFPLYDVRCVIDPAVRAAPTPTV